MSQYLVYIKLSLSLTSTEPSFCKCIRAPRRGRLDVTSFNWNLLISYKVYKRRRKLQFLLQFIPIELAKYSY